MTGHGAPRRTRHRYGPRRGQVADLWMPDSRRGKVPVVVLLHGGFWRAPYTKALMNGLAAAVAERGWAAWNVEYRRVGVLGGGGGWPATFTDVAGAVDHLASLDGVDTTRVATCGHSAGGQLALWVAGRGRLGPGCPWAPAAGVDVSAAVALAGVVDLEAGAALGLGGGAVTEFLGGGPEEVPERYRCGSPAAMAPLGVAQLLVHGSDDGVVPVTMSEHYCALASGRGDATRCVTLPGVGHRELISAGGAGWAVVGEYLEAAFS